MEIKRFIFQTNGVEVIKVTGAGVTGYIDASIPLEVLEIWHRRIGVQLKRISRLQYRRRFGKRRRLKPVRVRTRRRRPEKRYRGRIRHWSGTPRLWRGH